MKSSTDRKIPINNGKIQRETFNSTQHKIPIHFICNWHSLCRRFNSIFFQYEIKDENDLTMSMKASIVVVVLVSMLMSMFLTETVGRHQEGDGHNNDRRKRSITFESEGGQSRGAMW